MTHTGYKILPEVYDRWQQSYGKDFSALILPKVLGTIEKHGTPTSTLLDVASGTGTLALAMARKGWKVLAIDVSEGMIEEGMRKARALRVPITFIRQDMRSFSIPAKVGLITCMFDAVNHLTSRRDVFRCFRHVHAALESGGIFVFDVNNELGYRTVWQQTDVIHDPDFTIILQNSFDALEKRAESNVTLFLRHGKVFEKKTEIVRERLYSRNELHELLHRGGFAILESGDFNFTSDPKVGEIKTWWVARKEER